MNDSELFLVQLRTLRDQLAGVCGTIDCLLGVAERTLSPEEGVCDHPIQYRRPMPTMGHATRFFCTGCQETVEA